MNDDGASGALARAVGAALRVMPGISGVSDGMPASQADTHASLDIGPETDWGHKSGAGAEVRFAVMIRCGGDAPDRARRLLAAARETVEGIGSDLEGWRLVSLAFQRARTLRETGPRWTAVIEYRARLLA
jgi:hypothetical protein